MSSTIQTPNIHVVTTLLTARRGGRVGEREEVRLEVAAIVTKSAVEMANPNGLRTLLAFRKP